MGIGKKTEERRDYITVCFLLLCQNISLDQHVGGKCLSGLQVGVYCQDESKQEPRNWN